MTVWLSSENAGCKQATIWYNRLTMAYPTPIDISNIPELARIAEEVEATRTPRELKRENKTVAVIVPAKKSAPKERAKTKADYEAFFSAFGSWKDVDTDRLLKNIYATRKRSNRPPLEL
jgi:hypothetical protein